MNAIIGIEDCFASSNYILMEGALGERLKREYHMEADPNVALASLVHMEQGRHALRELWLQYGAIARRYDLPYLAMTPTRRANQDRIGMSEWNQDLLLENVCLLQSIQQEYDGIMYVGGLMGCKGDAYTGEGALQENEAYEFHRWQTELLRAAGVQYLYAGIMPTLGEAAGMARAMADTELPYIISFTIQRDGKLIDGTSIHDAIRYVDEVTSIKPLGYMTNCVHPTILHEALSQPMNQTSVVRNRVIGIQANTSPLSYEELDGCQELHCSEPSELAESMMKLQKKYGLKIFGGCCGTDDRHMEAIAKRLVHK